MNHWFKASSAVVLSLWITVPVVAAPPLKTTVCAILQKPSAFNGKLVQVKGTMMSGFEKFVLTDGSCGSIWVDLPDDQYDFKLVRDAQFADFERLIRANSLSEVTFIGRLDGVDAIKEESYVRERRMNEDRTNSAVVGRTSTGFGHMGQYKVRLVLKQVLTVGSAPASKTPKKQ